MVTKIGASGASIIGFQEFEPPQAEAFLEATDGAWGIVAGKRRGHSSTADAIAYQPSAWKVDEVRYVSIRYGGPMIQVPLVRFTSTSDSGRSGCSTPTTPPTPSAEPTRCATPRSAPRRGTAAAASRRAEHAAVPDRRHERQGPVQAAVPVAGRSGLVEPPTPATSRSTGSWAAPPSPSPAPWSTRAPTTGRTSYTDHPFVHTSVQLTGSTPRQPGGSAGLGVMPTGITATPGAPVKGQVLVANANIKPRSGGDPGRPRPRRPVAGLHHAQRGRGRAAVADAFRRARLRRLPRGAAGRTK